MAGYIMTISDLESLEMCFKTGIYSTIMSNPRNNSWGIHHEGTFADYLSMKQGDSIYFFNDRKIYGIGKIIDIKSDCKYLNYIGADNPCAFTKKEYKELTPLLSHGTPQNRCLCIFEPSPYFFRLSVDMDEALSSDPDKFKILRTMWKVSFIKVDDEENQALQDIILKRNESNLIEGTNIYSFDKKEHGNLKKRIQQAHRLGAYQILLNAANDNKIKHEMAIEAALCDVLGKENNGTPFGTWDYISHQVAASPFKPIDYMDKMDVFGYRYIKGFNTISKYLVIELKKDVANEDVIDQVMKYVDWINQEYAHGDYSMIEAYVVAADFPDSVVKKKNEQCIRNFTKGYRPTQACTWDNCRLIKYSYNGKHLVFSDSEG
ncbi:MAG: hypothetical protein ACI4EX_00715 [Lachnospiraceae bacterium]